MEVTFNGEEDVSDVGAGFRSSWTFNGVDGGLNAGSGTEAGSVTVDGNVVVWFLEIEEEVVVMLDDPDATIVECRERIIFMSSEGGKALRNSE